MYNAPYKTHWIYKRFYEKRGYTDVFNGVHNDTVYIYTTYLDNIDNLSDSYLNIVEECKNTDTEKYNHVYLGRLRHEQKGWYTIIGSISENQKYRLIFQCGTQ